MKPVFATVVSGWYQYYIPMFVYSIKKAYPNVGIRVFVREKLAPPVREILAKMSAEKWCGGKWRVIEKSLTCYAPQAGANALRLLLPSSTFENYSLLHIWDVDYIILPHTPSISVYMTERMKRSGLPYACFKGPSKRPRRPEIAPNGWTGKFTRVVHGISGFKVPEFMVMTQTARHKYREIARKRTHDGDRHKFGSYREYDEVMMYRILKQSGIKTPKARGVFPDGTKWGARYRDIHLGDFRMARWTKAKKMRGLYTKRNVAKFRDLEKDPKWQEIVAACCKNPNVSKVMSRLRKYMGKR